jgi:hypothetical protein
MRDADLSFPWVFCADIGSVQQDHFGWYGGDAKGRSMSGKAIGDLAAAVAEKINKGEKVALGFECPLFVPLREAPMDLTKARDGEGGRPWSAGAGCAVLATGLVEVTWILQHIRELTPKKSTPAFLDWKAFQKADAGVFFWEAFVSGKSKGEDHVHDAQIAVEKFQTVMSNVDACPSAIVEEKVLSLIGACLLRTGWATDLGHLSKPCYVIKP